MNIDELLTEMFSPGREPRSAEYKAGCRAALDFKLTGTAIPHPYKPGTAASDAFFAGFDEGILKWEIMQFKDE